MCCVVVLHCDDVWVCICAHVFGCIFISACLGVNVNVADGTRVAMPISAREAMARPSKKK